uniref:Troponin C, isoform 1 n=1 Tax=Cacopsylla melanoneura TaxID=428564 RepID=A0A8D9B5A2_9HEMI
MSDKPALSKDQMSMLTRAFEAFDTDKTGAIGTDIVGTIMEMMGKPQSDEALQQIIAEVDEDGSGLLEFNEFCTLAARFMEEEEENPEAMRTELREAFKLYDKEGNGYITTEVLREIISELDPNLDYQELNEMIEEIDSDGSGTIDFEEFMAIMIG